MASRAEPVGVATRAEPAAPVPPPPESAANATSPSLGGAIRAALQDFYFHSWRLLPANVVWAVVAVVLAGLIVLVPAAVVLLPILALPTAGAFRIATQIVRGDAVSFWDAIDAWRTGALATLSFGAGLVLAVLVFGVNIVTGLQSASPLGWAIATMAAWGLVGTWLFAWTAWPIVVDPRRQDRPFRDRLRLAGLLLLAHPIRIGALGLVLAAFLVLSTVAIVALVIVSVVLAALVASRYVLAAADRLEAGQRTTQPAIADTP